MATTVTPDTPPVSAVPTAVEPTAVGTADAAVPGETTVTSTDALEAEATNGTNGDAKASEERADKTAEKPVMGSPDGWPALHSEHPLLAFHSRLGAIIDAAGHSQIWGVTLDPTTSHFGTFLILQKYLRSVSGDIDAAAKELEATLKWRKEFGLDQGKADEDFGAEFEGLGYVTHMKREGNADVLCWNLYGAVKDLGSTFGDLDRFMRWRVGLMERAMEHLHLATTRIPIPDLDKGADPHRLTQIHVYTGVSFLRLDPRVKAASKATIKLMVAHYPETLGRKLFVGVPAFMSWMFAAVRLFINAETARKFSIVGDESGTAGELAGEKDDIPKRFGGISALELPALEKEAQQEVRSVAP